MEVAAAIIKRAAHVTVIGTKKVPFERVLGFQVGSIMQKLHEGHGVECKMNVNIQEFLMNSDGNVTAVLGADGTQIPGDVFLLGVGTILRSGYIKDNPKIGKSRDGSIVCNEWLEVAAGAPGLFVAGDTARYPLDVSDGKPVVVEHWGMAQLTGNVAASNMLNERSKSMKHHVPVFWTAQYGINFRYSGHAPEFDEIIFDDGKETIDPMNPKFAAFYVSKGKVVGLLTCGRDPMVAQFAEILAAGKSVLGQTIRNGMLLNDSMHVLNDIFSAMARPL